MVYLQIPEPIRSASYPDEEGYCFRRVYGRGKCNCGQGRAAQLQARRREQNQGMVVSESTLICAFGLTVISVDYIRKKVIVLLAFFGYLVCTVLYF